MYVTPFRLCEERAHVAAVPRVRLLFCTQLGQDDARYTDACMGAIVGWNGRRDHQLSFGADVMDAPVQE